MSAVNADVAIRYLNDIAASESWEARAISLRQCVDTIQEQAEEIERLRDQLSFMTKECKTLETWLEEGEQELAERGREIERLSAALEETKAVAGNGAGFYTDRIYTIARVALREKE